MLKTTNNGKIVDVNKLKDKVDVDCILARLKYIKTQYFTFNVP